MGNRYDVLPQGMLETKGAMFHLSVMPADVLGGGVVPLLCSLDHPNSTYERELNIFGWLF